MPIISTPDPWRETDLEERRAAVRFAVAAEQFDVRYVPSLDIETETIIGFSAEIDLVGEHGEIFTPSQFLAEIEALGIEHRFYYSLFHRVCSDAATWDAHLSVTVGIPLSIFNDRLFIDRIGRSLTETRIDAARIYLAINEIPFISDTASASFEYVRSTHMNISVDGFGAGYGSLGYLRILRPEKLILERALFAQFVRDEVHSDQMADSILGLGHALGARVVADGVETTAMLEWAVKKGFDEVRGAHIGEPYTSDAIARYQHRRDRPNHADRSDSSAVTVQRTYIVDETTAIMSYIRSSQIFIRDNVYYLGPSTGFGFGGSTGRSEQDRFSYAVALIERGLAPAFAELGVPRGQQPHFVEDTAQRMMGLIAAKELLAQAEQEASPEAPLRQAQGTSPGSETWVGRVRGTDPAAYLQLR